MEIRPVNQEILGPVGAGQSHSGSRPAGTSETSNVLSSDLRNYVDQAQTVADNNTDVDIAQIRSQMDAGQFDSPEAIRQAAENILNQGV